jgi:hypothetical protein
MRPFLWQAGHSIRILADYTGADMDPEKTAEIGKPAVVFLTAIKSRSSPVAPSATGPQSDVEP